MLERFPADFRWGVATSSYQIEGAVSAGGRSPSIWDTFCQTPGKVVGGDTGDIACDHFNRFESDIALMQELGIQEYRFSIAWPRLIPDGVGSPNEAGIDFYNRLVNALLAAGIKPVATLYHWDLPQVLQDRGGWANREIVEAFAAYAELAVARLGDRVKDWATLNEPWCTSWLGYMIGVHAPGERDLDKAIAASHHTALAHAVATRRMRAIRPDLSIGLVCNMTNYRVDDESNSELMELSGLMDSHVNRWWIEAFTSGMYPANLVQTYGERLARVLLPGDAELLRVETDFLGINYYSDSYITTPEPDDKPMIEGGLFPFLQRAGGKVPQPTTAMGWPITPNGLRDLCLRVTRDWPEVREILITENGAAFDGDAVQQGVVTDDLRLDYLRTHIEALGEAISAGAPVTRYFAWSFMDNFEWAEGYAKRFGIVHVDFETLVRTPKESALWYSSIIRDHSALSERVLT